MSFKVPEYYRQQTHPILGSTSKDGNNGYFEIPSCDPGWSLSVICSNQGGWEHVSVHAHDKSRDRIPNWREMCFIKDMFWDDEDVVMQLHPRKSRYKNWHNYTLHLWRPIGIDIPTPPRDMV